MARGDTTIAASVHLTEHTVFEIHNIDQPNICLWIGPTGDAVLFMPRSAAERLADILDAELRNPTFNYTVQPNKKVPLATSPSDLD